jgi:hypothetical protein
MIQPSLHGCNGFCVGRKTEIEHTENCSNYADSLTERLKNSQHDFFDLRRKAEQLKAENERLKHLLNCADSINFVSPDTLERDNNNGLWQFQREWNNKPIGHFETALDAFEAMDKHSIFDLTEKPQTQTDVECRDCKHWRQVENVVPFCNITRNEKGIYLYCSSERTNSKGCGADGKNFEAKEV